MKPAVVVIDMQNYFFRTEERSVALPKLIPAVNQLIDYAEQNKIPVFQVITVHKADGSTWNLVMKKYGDGALFEGSREAELLPEIHRNPSQELVIKTRQSTFIRTDFEERLKRLGVDTLILCGVFTHGCVGRTAVDAYERDFHVILAKEASFSHLKEQEKVMLEVITVEQEQKVLGNEEIIQLLSDNCFTGQPRKFLKKRQK